MKKQSFGHHLKTTQKRRQWEFLSLRHQSDQISKLLGEASDEEKRKELESKHNALQARGQQILDEQIKFLKAKHRRLHQAPAQVITDVQPINNGITISPS